VGDSAEGVLVVMVRVLSASGSLGVKMSEIGWVGSFRVGVDGME